ncbi:MAG: GNAT family N-acetyltransferase [Leptolyngbyaceae cyanobacterium MAG.088]|nr:GNAT family N-acetyltransferase [Leptolyngbyaceae cyanobacterium MAG.088]
MSQLQIRDDDLTGQAIAAFLQAHLDEMYEITPPESVHALDLDSLRVPEITFWSVWEGNVLVGCGALKELDTISGEIKSMRTDKVHRGKGIASAMLKHIIQTAKQRNYTSLNLETGSMAEFAPARALYTRHGFEYRGPFGDYVADPNSVFMIKRL